MNRRDFLNLLAAAPLGTRSSRAQAPVTNRERMLRWLAGETEPGYTPAAFFLHFGEGYKTGVAAARRHLEFYRQTGMDFVKIQFEQTYTPQSFLKKPADWSKLPLSKLDFYEPQLVTVRELVRAEKKNSLVVMTLYSPFMCAGHCATTPVLLRHLEENPEAVKKGLEILTESQMLFVRACIKEGVDGFYASTQGGEANRFSRPEIFERCVKPFDLVAMKEISTACPFNILHVCDYVAPYANYKAHYDYPGHVVNCNTKLVDHTLQPAEIAKSFRRPFMGGLDRHGILAAGSSADLQREVKAVIANAPRPFVLAADCTVEAATDWNRLKQAISLAHGSASA